MVYMYVHAWRVNGMVYGVFHRTVCPSAMHVAC